MLEGRWNNCVDLGANNVDEKKTILNNSFSLLGPGLFNGGYIL